MSGTGAASRLPGVDLPEAAATTKDGTASTAVLAGPHRYQVTEADANDLYLTKVLGNTSNVPCLDRNSHVIYNATMSSSTHINGIPDICRKLIQYHLTPRSDNGNIPSHAADSCALIDCIDVQEFYQKEINAASVKNAALPRSFLTIGLLGIAERLAKACAKFSMYGTLTTSEIRGGNSWNVKSIMAAVDNLSVGPGNVFVTKRMADVRYPGVIPALMAAINGEGSTVYTDLLSLNHNGVVQISVVNGLPLAIWCHEALRLIGAIYRDCDEGPAFAMAITRGVHAMISVNGHSDEGGWVRQVLRRGHYSAPNGAIFVNGCDDPYNGIPTPRGGMQSFRAVYHAIALATAGLSAACDPMVSINGKLFPTTLSLLDGDEEEAHTSLAAKDITDDMRDAMQAKWAEACPRWSVLYAFAVGKLFNITGSTSTASHILDLCASDAVGMVDDHLRHPVVVAYYWIEPTSVVPFLSKYLPATVENCGPLTMEGYCRSVAGFRGVTDVRQFGFHTVFNLDFRFARRHGYFIHHEQHPKDGTGNMHLYSGEPSLFANVGGTTSVRDRILDGAAISDFLWGRLHNQIIGIGEFINLNKKLQIGLQHVTAKISGRGAARVGYWNSVESHVPSVTDLNNAVTFRVCRPSSVDGASVIADCRKWSRSRTAAAKALSLAKVRSPLMSQVGVTIRPRIGEPMEQDEDEVVDEVTRNQLVGYDFAGTLESAVEATNPVILPTTASGNMVSIVTHNVADRGRKVVRATGGATGSGGGGKKHRGRSRSKSKGRTDGDDDGLEDAEMYEEIEELGGTPGPGFV